MEDMNYPHQYDYMNVSSPRWTEAGTSTAGGSNQDAKSYQKLRQMDSVMQLLNAAESLMSKLYQMRKILECPDMASYQFSENFWKAGIFPDLPKLCLHMAKKFPEHTAKLQLEKVDKLALDQLQDNAEFYLSSLEPWLMLILDLMRFREQAVKVILDLSSTVITFLPNQNPLILHALMNLFCSFIRVNLLAGKVPRKMLLQTYNLAHSLSRNGRDYEFYHRLVQYVDSYDPPLKGLQEDLNTVISPRIGEILEGIASTVLLGVDYQKLRNEGFLSPFHPRYPDKLTNSAHPARAQDLAYVDSYRDWVLLGYLVCPIELLRGSAIDIAMAILQDTLVFPLFRDEFILIHDEYQLHVLPRIDESKRTSKSGRKQKDSDPEYNLAKQVKKMICDAQDIAINRADSSHRDRRTFIRQELSRMVLFFSDQPSLIAPNIQMIFSALSMARTELIWYFTHVGVLAGKPKVGRLVPVEIEATDPSIGFLLSGMDKLQGLIHKYISAIRGYALGYLAGAAERINNHLNSQGLLSLNLEPPLQQVLNAVSDCLDKLPKVHNEAVLDDDINLSGFRNDWTSFMMLVSSSRSTINIRHFEKAAISTGKESIISEGNAAYLWSRSVDDIEGQIMQHSSLKVLYFYRQHLTTVFRHTMFGPEGRPQHCCAWLKIANSFSENSHANAPEEQSKLAQDAISYVETFMESTMGGFEGLINILDSEGGFGSLEYKLSPDQASIRLNQAAKTGQPSGKYLKNSLDLPLPGSESEPANRDAVKMLEAAIQRLTGLCTAINEMEPVCILGHVFIPQEYLREHIMNNFRRRFIAIVSSEGLQRPSVIEALILRHMQIVHLIEKHVSMDLKQGMREILLKEAFSGPMRDLQDPEMNESTGGTAVSIVCNWFMDNVVKDVSGAGVVFNPSDKTFRGSRPMGPGSSLTEILADISELKAFVRVFGPYGVDKLETLLHEYLSVLVGCIDIALRTNKDALETLALNMHNHYERGLALKQVQDIESLMAFSIQIGHALSFRLLLSEAASDVLGGNVPTIFGLLSDFAKYAPSSIPENPDILKLKKFSDRLGASFSQDAAVLHSVLVKVGGAGDSMWILLPYLYVCCMVSNVWATSGYSIFTGGFNSNVHCLARCINAVMVASEFIRSERKELQRKLSQQEMSKESSEMEKLDSEALSLEGMAAVEASIKSMMKTYIQCSVVIILDSWNDGNRSPLVAKLIFLEILCESSKYLPRSTLESHVPYTILRSIYQLYYENAVPTLVLINSSRRQLPDGELANGGYRSGTPVGASKMANQRRYSGTEKEISGAGYGIRLSGPLDQTGGRKGSFSDGSSAARSGPLSYRDH